MGKKLAKLIEQVKIRYPIGTKVNNRNIFGDGRGNEFTITGDDVYAYTDYAVSISSTSVDHGGSYTLYRDKKWADITKKVVTELDKARKIIYSD